MYYQSFIWTPRRRRDLTATMHHERDTIALVDWGSPWSWAQSGTEIMISGSKMLATKIDTSTKGLGHLVTGGDVMTQGRHYWEVKLTAGSISKSPGEDQPQICTFIGATRPGLDHNSSHSKATGAYYIAGYNGSKCGSGAQTIDHGHKQGACTVGDHIGVLLDLDLGWIRFFRNGERFGPGYTEGVTGPLVRAAEIFNTGAVTVVPDVQAPPCAGDEEHLEGWEYSCGGVKELKAFCKAKGLKVGGTRPVLQARLEADRQLHEAKPVFAAFVRMDAAGAYYGEV